MRPIVATPTVRNAAKSYSAGLLKLPRKSPVMRTLSPRTFYCSCRSENSVYWCPLTREHRLATAKPIGFRRARSVHDRQAKFPEPNEIRSSVFTELKCPIGRALTMAGYLQGFALQVGCFFSESGHDCRGWGVGTTELCGVDRQFVGGPGMGRPQFGPSTASKDRPPYSRGVGHRMCS